MLLQCLVIVAIAFAVHGVTLGNGFVWDDTIYLLGNKMYANFRLKEMFNPAQVFLEYFPIRDLSLSIDTYLFGSRPFGYHATALVLYGINIIAVYFLSTELSHFFKLHDPPPQREYLTTPFCITLLFALHPIHVEPISMITNRGALLVGFFTFSACAYYLRFIQYGNKPAYAGALLLFVCSLLSKQYGIILPLLLILFSVMASQRSRLRGLIGTLPFMAASLGAFVLYRSVAERTALLGNANIIGNGFGKTMASILQIPFFYLKKLLFPFALAPEYAFSPAESQTSPVIAISILTAVLIAVSLLYWGRRHPWLIAGVGWVVITLIPFLNVYNTHPIVSDRYTYLSSFGICFIAGGICSHGLAARRLVASTTVLFAIVIASFAWQSLRQDFTWHDNISLWKASSQVEPTEYAYSNLAFALYDAGRNPEALDASLRGRSLNPASSTFEILQGKIALDSGRTADALQTFQGALVRSDYAAEMVHYNMGLAYEKLGLLTDAAENYLKVLEGKDSFYSLKVSAGERLRRLQRNLEPQLAHYQKRITENPSDIMAYGEKALLLDRYGMFTTAEVVYRQMERLGMRDWRLSYNLGNVLKKQGKFEPSIKAFQESLALNPRNPEALNNLGLVYRQMKNYDMALDVFSKAMQIDSSYAYAPFQMGITLALMGKKEEAIRIFNYTSDRFPAYRVRVDQVKKQLE